MCEQQVAIVSIFATAVPFAGLIEHFGPKLLMLDSSSDANNVNGGAGVLEIGSTSDVDAASCHDGDEGVSEDVPPLHSPIVEGKQEEDLLGIETFMPVLNPPQISMTRGSGVMLK
jgi:hypothetical protein